MTQVPQSVAIEMLRRLVPSDVISVYDSVGHIDSTDYAVITCKLQTARSSVSGVKPAKCAGKGPGEDSIIWEYMPVYGWFYRFYIRRHRYMELLALCTPIEVEPEED
jgi:hypothetical protein